MILRIYYINQVLIYVVLNLYLTLRLQSALHAWEETWALNGKIISCSKHEMLTDRPYTLTWNVWAKTLGGKLNVVLSFSNVAIKKRFTLRQQIKLFKFNAMLWPSTLKRKYVWLLTSLWNYHKLHAKYSYIFYATN